MARSLVKKNSAYGFMAVEIEINHDCNRACAYCPNSSQERRSQGRMSKDLFLLLLSQLRELDYAGRISYHFYNEPLLSPDLDEYVELTKSYLPSCWIDLYTNGTLLNEEKLTRLAKLGVDKFSVTKHHGSKDYIFDRVFEELPPPLKRKVRFQGYRELTLTNRGGLVKVGVKDAPPLDLACLVPSSLAVITVNGNVLPCYEDYHEQNSMGNIRESSLLEIWNSDKYKQFRADLIARKRANYPVCKECNCRRIVI